MKLDRSPLARFYAEWASLRSPIKSMLFGLPLSECASAGQAIERGVEAFDDRASSDRVSAPLAASKPCGGL